MSGRYWAWFLSGFAAALIIGALSGPVRAQGSPPAVTNPSLPSSSSGVLRGRSPVEDMDDAAAAQAAAPAPVPDDTAEPPINPDDQDSNDPSSPPPGQRPIVQDGDLTYPQEPVQARDGIVDVGEAQVAPDGADPSTTDTRPAEDVALFENPPAGYDPLLFQIDDLDPILDNRRTTRLFTREPFDPVGIKIGSFVLFPEAEFGGSYYSNVFRAPDGKADVAADLKPSARLVSNWARHAVELRATAGLSAFSNYDTENDKSWLVEGRGRFDITKRTNVQALISHETAPESRSALDASSVGTRSTQTTDRVEAALNQRFNRLSLQFRGSVADFAYGDTTNAGTLTSNADRDYTQTAETGRATWEFKPTLSAFTEVEVIQRNYDRVASTDLISRDSDGERYRAGLSFGNTGQILRGEVSLGYGIETPDDKRLKSVDGLLIDANATWRATDVTSVLFSARTDVAETTTSGVGGSFNRAVGVEVRHELQRYLIASAGLTYTTQNSEDGVISEQELRTALGLEYYATPETTLFTRYAHTAFNAVGTASDYDNDEVHVGVRWRR